MTHTAGRERPTERVARMTPGEQAAVRIVDELYRDALRAQSRAIDGPERYDRLVSRVVSAGLSARTIPDWIEHACVHLGLGSTGPRRRPR